MFTYRIIIKCSNFNWLGILGKPCCYEMPLGKPNKHKIFPKFVENFRFASETSVLLSKARFSGFSIIKPHQLITFVIFSKAENFQFNPLIMSEYITGIKLHISVIFIWLIWTESLLRCLKWKIISKYASLCAFLSMCYSRNRAYSFNCANKCNLMLNFE